MGSTTKVELTTVADCQSSLHRLVTLTSCPSTVVCAIPGEVEEGERSHHIMAMPPPHKKFAIQQYKRPTTSNSQSAESLSPEATLAKYIAAINHEDQTNVFASQEHAVSRPLGC